MSKIENLETEVACLFLCAGQSARMPGANKLLTRFDDRTVLATCANEIKKAQFSEIIAVTGFETELVEAELLSVFIDDDARFKIVKNADFENGMHSSIRAGLSKLSKRSGFVAICLADQPLLLARDFNLLISAARENPQARLISPYYKGTRGNPTLISLELKEEVLRHPDSDRGCSYLFEIYRNATIHVPMPQESRDIDVDTEAELMKARESINAVVATY